MKKLLLLLFISLFLILSCGKVEGQFAFKTPADKSYRINQQRLEFNSDDEINWVYKFKNTFSKRVKLGVIVMKKELGWVDVLATPDYVDGLKNIVYGTINGFEPGEYRIIITEITEENSVIIDSCYFYLYSEEDLPD